MEYVLLVKLGELTLKGNNRDFFINTLRSNLERALGNDFRLLYRHNRFYIPVETDEKARRAMDVLSKTAGIVKYSRAIACPRDMEQIKQYALKMAKEAIEKTKGRTFKIEAKRADKGFPLTSYELACELGSHIAQNIEDLTVRMTEPDWVIRVEIREQTYIYWQEEPAMGGLPVGVAGRGMLLLSGGIDSPVAGYLMAKRGLEIMAAYFHTYPYTSDDALNKVKELARILSIWTGKLTLFTVPFTETQLSINKNAARNEITLHMRAAMVETATILAQRNGALSLITGESLGQVASQTQESMRFTQHTTNLPVFRPLVGMDKEEIIKIARKIGTFETSTLPYDDCCTLFAPKRPMIRPNYEKTCHAYKNLELKELIQEAAEKSEKDTYRLGERI
ncbi:tRNA uracil 4-sulfurtransferase ThiI [Spirochaetia bacterium 38H-sp]|uniref:Probable tRNA sulfurtransferase n=1 Tax=Rarispira pelagica TaxID=3141764 RepID=A0ABU9UCG1_9SPIR